MKMLKNLLAIILLVVCHETMSAQRVNIPSNFAGYIKKYVDSTAITGNQLDTTKASIINLQNLTINDTTITDITGIQYFKHLQNLIFGDILSGDTSIKCCPRITFIPQLPASLKTIEVTSSSLTMLPARLPDSLQVIKFPKSNISTWPAIPNSVRKIILSFSISSVLPALPSRLDTLILDSCRNLSSLPSVLPSTLKMLCVDSAALTTLPPLPVGLVFLNVAHNHGLNQLPTLSDTLKYLIVNNTSISTVGAKVPKKLIWLDVSRTKVTSLPTLPDTMSTLNIGYTPINSLTHLPKSVDFLLMDSVVLLRSFPNYPTNVFTVYADYVPKFAINTLVSSIRTNQELFYLKFNGTNNGIGSFDHTLSLCHDSIVTPPTINSTGYRGIYMRNNLIKVLTCKVISKGQYLDFQHNVIDSVVSYCSGSLENVNLGDNKLKSTKFKLPYNDVLKTGVGLIVYKNQIMRVDTIGVIANLDLDNNQVSCLPLLPTTLKHLQIAGNPVNCLPNAFTGYCNVSLPVCQMGNTNNCTATGIITGKVFDDHNCNGHLDRRESGIKGYTVYLDANGQTFSTITDSTGRYKFWVPVHQNCRVYTAQGNSPCSSHNSRTINICRAWQIDSLVDFGFCNGTGYVQDLSVKVFPIGHAKPGFHHQYYVQVKNEGNVMQKGKATMNFNPALQFVSANNRGARQGNNVVWSFDSLQAYQIIGFTTDFIMPASTTLGTNVAATSIVSSNVGDVVRSNNKDSIAETVKGSYDPNEKTVTPSALTQTEIDTQTYLNYQIQFQNTGTDSAIDVSVQDTLSDLLDLNTFEFITSSAEAEWSLDGHVLTVNFYNINLHDSISDEPNSHGFFAYRIRPTADFDATKRIENTAYITFDYNAPIATNTAVAAKDATRPVNTTEANNISIFPCPASNMAQIAITDASPDDVTQLDLVNMSGQHIQQVMLYGQQKYTLDVSHLPQGIYMAYFYNNSKRTVLQKRVEVLHW